MSDLNEDIWEMCVCGICGGKLDLDVLRPKDSQHYPTLFIYCSVCGAPYDG